MLVTSIVQECSRWWVVEWQVMFADLRATSRIALTDAIEDVLVNTTTFTRSLTAMNCPLYHTSLWTSFSVIHWCVWRQDYDILAVERFFRRYSELLQIGWNKRLSRVFCTLGLGTMACTCTRCQHEARALVVLCRGLVVYCHEGCFVSWVIFLWCPSWCSHLLLFVKHL